MCFYCKGKMVDSMTVFTVELSQNCLLIVKNVPCRECAQCGEIEYTDETMQKLEQIVASARMLMQEIAVVDFRTAA